MRPEHLLYALVVAIAVVLAVARGFVRTQALSRAADSPWEVAGVVILVAVIAALALRRLLRD